MEMIERVARAISGQDEYGWSALPEDARERLYGGGRWGDNSPTRLHFRLKARAAIEAMREPDEAMIDASAETPGMKAASCAMEMHQARGYGFADGAFDEGAPLLQAWRAGIDAALSTPPEPVGRGK